MVNVFLFINIYTKLCYKVADEIADLDVHCRYGCIKESGGYKVNPDG